MVKTSRRPAPPPEPFWAFVRSLFLKTLRSALFFVFDTTVAAVIITCIWALSRVFPALWGPEDPLLFDRLPLRYLFNAGEGAVIVVYVLALVRHAVAEFLR
jgi:hypothetical protein